MQTSTAEIDRRTESRRAIEELVHKRTEMLSIYSELATMRPFSGKVAGAALQRFCQALVDYTAEAHFRLYQFIETRQERRAAVLDFARNCYPRISDTTTLILDFNDKYDGDPDTWPLDTLEGELSELGEILADRIELEDRLVSELTRPKN